MEPELSPLPFESRRAAETRQPPQNLDAERAILGAVMLDRDALGVALESIRADDFYRREHRVIFGVMCDLYENDQAIDGITVAEELERRGELLKCGGNDYLADILAATATAANVAYHGRIVRDKAVLRGLIHASGEITTDAFAAREETDAILDRAQTRIYAIAESRETQAFASVRDVCRRPSGASTRPRAPRATSRGCPPASWSSTA